MKAAGRIAAKIVAKAVAKANAEVKIAVKAAAKAAQQLVEKGNWKTQRRRAQRLRAAARKDGQKAAVTADHTMDLSSASLADPTPHPGETPAQAPPVCAEGSPIMARQKNKRPRQGSPKIDGSFASGLLVGPSPSQLVARPADLVLGNQAALPRG